MLAGEQWHAMWRSPKMSVTTFEILHMKNNDSNDTILKNTDAF